MRTDIAWDEIEWIPLGTRPAGLACLGGAANGGGFGLAASVPELFQHFVHAPRIDVISGGDSVLELASPIAQPNVDGIFEG